MDKKVNRNGKTNDSNRKASDGDNQADGLCLSRNFFGFAFFRGLERRQFLFERGGDDLFVFELKREPAAVEFVFPFSGQAHENFGGRRLEAIAFPERRAL